MENAIQKISGICGQVGTDWEYDIKNILFHNDMCVVTIRLVYQGMVCELIGEGKLNETDPVNRAATKAFERAFILLKKPFHTSTSEPELEPECEAPLQEEKEDSKEAFYLDKDSFTIKCSELKELNDLNEANERRQKLLSFNLRSDQKDILLRILNKRITELENIALFGEDVKEDVKVGYIGIVPVQGKK
jgi:hypothetical protein